MINNISKHTLAEVEIDSSILTELVTNYFEDAVIVNADPNKILFTREQVETLIDESTSPNVT